MSEQSSKSNRIFSNIDDHALADSTIPFIAHVSSPYSFTIVDQHFTPGEQIPNIRRQKLFYKLEIIPLGALCTITPPPPPERENACMVEVKSKARRKRPWDTNTQTFQLMQLEAPLPHLQRSQKQSQPPFVWKSHNLPDEAVYSSIDEASKTKQESR